MRTKDPLGAGLILSIFIVFSILVWGLIFNVLNAKEIPFTPTREFTDVRVITHPYKTRKEVVEACAAIGIAVSVSEPGCARMQKACEIWFVLPSHSEDQERLALLGHELLHCLYGRYHEEGV